MYGFSALYEAVPSLVVVQRSENALHCVFSASGCRCINCSSIIQTLCRWMALSLMYLKDVFFL